ncbi:hypothetical protein D9M71_700010 [compost metagenome]
MANQGLLAYQARLSSLLESDMALLQMLQMRCFHFPLLLGRQLLPVEGRSIGHQSLFGSLLHARN